MFTEMKWVPQLISWLIKHRVNKSDFITPAPIWLALDCNASKGLISSARWSFPTAVSLFSVFTFPRFIHHHVMRHWLKWIRSVYLLPWKQSCFLICYVLLWRLKQLEQWKISWGLLSCLTLTWHCSHSDKAWGRTRSHLLRPCLSTTWRLMMSISPALHSLWKQLQRC